MQSDENLSALCAKHIQMNIDWAWMYSFCFLAANKFEFGLFASACKSVEQNTRTSLNHVANPTPFNGNGDTNYTMETKNYP